MRKIAMNRYGSSVLAAFLTVMSGLTPVNADVRLPGLISDNMLLQTGPATRIWGWADAGEKVSVTLQGTTVSATADQKGHWQVKVNAKPAAEPMDMTVAGKNTITIKNVLVGEVWFVAGQSNVWWPVSRTDNADQEIAAAKHPKLRLFAVPVRAEPKPVDDITLTYPQTVPEMPQPAVSGKWVECSPEIIGDFSGLAYYFGRDLHKDLDVPVGIISAGVGGTLVEAWTSESALQANPDCKWIIDHWTNYKANVYPKKLAEHQVELAKWKASVEAAKANDPNSAEAKAPQPEAPIDADRYVNRCAALYNGMVAPLTPFTIKGAAWYQGESNAGKPETYALNLKVMIQDWRKAWNVGEFPFLIVQLPNVDTSKFPSVGKEWAGMREAQMDAAELPNTGIVVTIDLGKADDMHPKNKQDVCRRMATLAEGMAYDKKVAVSGPVLQSKTISGRTVKLKFKHAEGGLTSPSSELTGFEVAGADGKYVSAKARIEADSVIVESDAVDHPVAVKYAWLDNPTASLFNKAGLPASPFRTDRKTQDAK